jgi:threonine dehydrogenase-like Zn-dependent dehydrogenase
MTLMLAARAHGRTGPLQVEKVAVPQPGPRDVLIRVASAGLAPSLTKLLERGSFKHLPTVPGHEIAGTVEAVGEEVNGGLAGARVRVHPLLACGTCRYCRGDREQMCPSVAMIGHGAHGSGPMPLYERYHDGGLAEYVRVPAGLVDMLPEGVTPDVGAKVHDLANAVRALKCADLAPGGTLVVTASTGAMGTATIRLAPFFGAARLVLVGRSAERLEAVRALSALPAETVALDELGGDWESEHALTARLRVLVPDGADAVIDFLPGGGGTAQATAALATGGTLVHMGGNRTPFPYSARDLQHHCWRVVGTRACTRTDTATVLDLLGSGALHADDLITHRYPLTEVNEVVAAMRERTEPSWMVVIRP